MLFSPAMQWHTFTGLIYVIFYRVQDTALRKRACTIPVKWDNVGTCTFLERSYKIVVPTFVPHSSACRFCFLFSLVHFANSLPETLLVFQISVIEDTHLVT